MADANRFEVQLTDYLQAVVRRHGLLNLGSFQERHERQVKTVRLDQIYVPLRLAGSHPWEEGEERGARPGKTGDDLLSNQLLLPRRRLGRHLVVLGDAGSGKTTILRHLTVSLADAWLGQDAAVAAQQTGFQDGLAEMPWPLFVPLRHFEHFCQANNHGLTWGSFLQFLPEHFGQLYNVVVDPAFYRQLLQSGRCLLALDGFDEISDMNVRHQAVEMVHTLANGQQTGRNHIILSSRVAAYGGPAQLGMDFRTVWVQNLNREERQTQVEKWVEEVSASTGRGLQAGDILERMPEGSALDELAVTPMIVTTLCVVYFYDHELPEQRALLYRRC
ncbi:MAG: NACHT domain-containing protein, partial [Chloroflexi bacterium]|nr:NACHT domain-containing protein [Chloroflexota bacterium]